jgi:hypothetical protein
MFIEHIKASGLLKAIRSYGPMDKALDYESRDSRFDPW